MNHCLNANCPKCGAFVENQGAVAECGSCAAMSLSINAVAAANELATVIELGGKIELTHDGATAIVSGDRDFTELRFMRDGRWVGAYVCVERPTVKYGGTITKTAVAHSSSSRHGTIEDVKTTVRVLQLALEVASYLDAWADMDDSRVKQQVQR